MPTDITSRLRSFLQRPNPVLFAGAGVAARVGYPTWNQYIIHLADVCEEFKDSADTGEEKELVEYFVTLGLRKYDENMSADLQSLAERCAEEAAAEAKAQELDLSSATKQPDKKNRFLDRFENHFYEYWDEAIRRRQREATENMEG